VEVLPRVSSNCTEEILVTWNGTSLYVDPISYVIKSAASPTRCNDIAPARWKIAGGWYCAYPSIRECAPPRDLPVKPVNIKDEDLLDLGLGRSIYSKAQVEEFLKFRTPREPDGLTSRRPRSWPTEDVERTGRGDSAGDSERERPSSTRWDGH
jgi:hypothetical protein